MSGAIVRFGLIRRQEIHQKIWFAGSPEGGIGTADAKGIEMKQASLLRQTLEADILDGRLKPGTRLDENQLASKFNVSRTPIREALAQLAAAGLVDVSPRRSAVVSKLSVTDVIEMFETMAELEAVSGRLAARRLTGDDERAILAAQEACVAAAEILDADAYYDANVAFHGAIYTATHNRYLADQALSLHRRLGPLRRLQLRSRNRIRASAAEHQDIVEALLSGDGELASTRLRDHVPSQGERFSDVLIALDRLEAS